MNTYSRCGNWIDYHSYPRTSLARPYKWARALLPGCSQKSASKAVCTNWNLWLLQTPLSCTPVQWGIGVTLAQMVGPLRLERCRTALSRECLFHCEYRVTVGYNQINELNESVSGIPGQGKGGKWGWGDQWWVSSAAGMPRQDVRKKERRRAGYSRLTQRHLIRHWQWLDFYLLLRACFMSKLGVFNDQGMDQFLLS